MDVVEVTVLMTRGHVRSSRKGPLQTINHPDDKKTCFKCGLQGGFDVSANPGLASREVDLWRSAQHQFNPRTDQFQMRY